ENRTDDLRNHLTCAVHQDGVAHADVLATDVIFVVERGLRDRHAAYLDRLEDRVWIQTAGAAHVHFDGLQHRRGLDRWELEGDRPARFAADRSELDLHVE